MMLARPERHHRLWSWMSQADHGWVHRPAQHVGAALAVTAAVEEHHGCVLATRGTRSSALLPGHQHLAFLSVAVDPAVAVVVREHRLQETLLE